MKTRLLPLLCLAALGLSAVASADRVYYLVGLRHVYSVPVFPDTHELDRQAIEEDYSGAVAQSQKQYDADMASIHDEEAKDGGNIHQVDRDAVQENLEKGIADAAEKRDADLGSLYPQVDDVRRFHSEFKVDQDGPYKVIGIDTAPSGEYVNVVYYRPYPAYVEPCPYGWYWGRPYAYNTWGVQIGIWHSTWITIGCPVYEPMYYGGVIFVIDAPIRTEVICTRDRWVGGYPPHITERQRRELYAHRDTQERSHYYDRARNISQSAGGVKLRAPLAPPVTRTGAIVAPGLSPYSHRIPGGIGGGSNSTSSYSHTATPGGTGTTRTGTSLYSRTNGGSTVGGTSSSGYSRSGSTGSTPGGATTGTSRYSRSTGSTGTSSGSSTSSTGSSTGRYSRTTGGSSTTSKTGSSSSTTGSTGSRYGHSTSGTGSSTKTGSGSGSSTSGSKSSGSTSSGTSGNPKKPGGN